MPQYLFFDLDGTISDTHGLARATWLELLRPYGLDVDFELYKQSIHGKERNAVLQELLPDLDPTERRDLCDRERDIYDRRLRNTTPLPGLAPFLDRAHRAGFDLALVTNAPRDDANRSLLPLGFEATFTERVFADDADVAAEKPDAAPYRAALSRLNISADRAVAFEDSTTGVQSAVAAGIATIGVATTHHPAELRNAGARLIVGDYVDTALDDPGTLVDG